MPIHGDSFAVSAGKTHLISVHNVGIFGLGTLDILAQSAYYVARKRLSSLIYGPSSEVGNESTTCTT